MYSRRADYGRGYSRDYSRGYSDRGYIDRGYTDRQYTEGYTRYTGEGYTRGYTGGYTRGYDREGYSGQYTQDGYYDDDNYDDGYYDDYGRGTYRDGYTYGRAMHDVEVMSVGESVDSYRLRRRSSPRYRGGRSLSPLSSDEEGEYRGGEVVERKCQSAPLRPPPREGVAAQPSQGHMQMQQFQQHLISAFRRAVGQMGGPKKPKETTYVIVPGGSGQAMRTYVMGQSDGQTGGVAASPAPFAASQPKMTAAAAPSHNAAGSVVVPRVKVVNGQPIMIQPTPVAASQGRPGSQGTVTPPAAQVLGADPNYQAALSAAQSQVQAMFQSGTRDPEALLAAASTAFTSQYNPQLDPAALSKAASQELARASQRSIKGSQSSVRAASTRPSQPSIPATSTQPDPEVEAALEQFERLHSGSSSQGGSVSSSQRGEPVYTQGFDRPEEVDEVSTSSHGQRFTWSENK